MCCAGILGGRVCSSGVTHLSQVASISKKIPQFFWLWRVKRSYLTFITWFAEECSAGSPSWAMVLVVIVHAKPFSASKMILPHLHVSSYFHFVKRRVRKMFSEKLMTWEARLGRFKIKCRGALWKEAGSHVPFTVNGLKDAAFIPTQAKFTQK